MWPIPPTVDERLRHDGPGRARHRRRAGGARFSTWADHHLAFDDDERVYASLQLICWTKENDTGWHDHDVSSGAVAVVSGALLEHNLGVGADHVRTVVPEGKVLSFGPDHIHGLTGECDGSVSVHAYSPPLWRMGQYAVSDAGVLRRRSVSYADELRPLEDQAKD